MLAKGVFFIYIEYTPWETGREIHEIKKICKSCNESFCFFINHLESKNVRNRHYEKEIPFCNRWMNYTSNMLGQYTGT